MYNIPRIFNPQYRNEFRNNFDQDERGFALPLLAGLAITAPFWAGGFGYRRCCPPYYPAPYPAPYPLPTPYPAPYPFPTPYAAGGLGLGYGTGVGGAGAVPGFNPYVAYPSPYTFYNRRPYII